MVETESGFRRALPSVQHPHFKKIKDNMSPFLYGVTLKFLVRLIVHVRMDG